MYFLLVLNFATVIYVLSINVKLLKKKKKVLLTVRDYWNFLAELTLHNGVLFKNQRIIIPHSLRSEMLARLHSSHLGIEACLRKARDRIYWPNMTTHIKEAVAK